MTPRRNPDIHVPLPIRWVGIFLALLIVAGCGGSYGSLQRSRQVSTDIESLKILPGYDYYFSGSFYKPRAIIGIHQDYTLVSKLWKPVPDLTVDRLQTWIVLMTNEKGYAFRNLGSNILNAEGEAIGIWYSPEDFTTIRMLGDKQVSIYPPVGRPTFGKFVKYQLP